MKVVVMNSTGDLSWEEASGMIDSYIYSSTGKHLTDLETDVLRGAWDGKSYDEIAEELFRSVSYINKDVGYRLWKKLSEALGEEVNKKSFRQALFRRAQQSALQESKQLADNSVELPDGFVPWNSRFYVQRDSIESDCDREILKPGALIRIKAPKKMGKTSLLNRILVNAELHGYQAVRLNLRKAEKTVFSNLDKFLRWFCANVARQLGLESQLNEYWDEEIGSKVSCTGYFQSYILEKIQGDLVIGLDEIDTIFSYPYLAEDFLALLREWHEEATLQDTWQRLRLVISHATEVYISLNIYQSPFNVGVPITLPDFTKSQVTELAKLHGLTWQSANTDELMAMVGGHPYLVRLALYHLSRQILNLDCLLAEAPTYASIYAAHLRGCLEQVKQQPELAIALKQIVTDLPMSRLDPLIVYQLDSLGLIKIYGDRVTSSYPLYRLYFASNL